MAGSSAELVRVRVFPGMNAAKRHANEQNDQDNIWKKKHPSRRSRFWIKKSFYSVSEFHLFSILW